MMEFIRIGSDTLIVTLTTEEYEEFLLSEQNSSATLIDSVRSILTLAGGGWATASPLSVQLYTSSGGECEIFVHELQSSPLMSLTGAYQTETLTRGELSPENRYCIYAFDSMANLLCACEVLGFAGYKGKSAAYLEQDTGRYYLVIDCPSPIPPEHGAELCRSTTLYYINEHCRLVCNDAVSMLGALA